MFIEPYTLGFLLTNAAFEFAAPSFVESIKVGEPLSTVALAALYLGERERPLTLLRCPGGVGKECFVQKHPSDTMPDDLPSVAIAEKSGKHDYLYVRSAAELVALVQMGTIEFHLWNSRVDDLERPDQLVFDLDPAPDCEWQAVIDVAGELRQTLAELDLVAFLRTTGGKVLVEGQAMPARQAKRRAKKKSHATKGQRKGA